MVRAIAFAALVAVAAPASAATYTGKPVSPAGEAKFVGRDIIWNLSGDSYRGSTAESRPLVLCQSLAKRAGRLENFTVDGRAFAEAELTKCNAVAPAATGGAVAKAN